MDHLNRFLLTKCHCCCHCLRPAVIYNHKCLHFKHVASCSCEINFWNCSLLYNFIVFILSVGKNTCPQDAECKKFSEIFTSSTQFCQEVWDGSWSVVPDDKPCMKLWFDGYVKNYIM